MILVLILSAANQEWLSAVFHLAVLALLQLAAVWAKRRDEPADEDWRELYARLERLYGDGEKEGDTA